MLDFISFKEFLNSNGSITFKPLSLEYLSGLVEVLLIDSKEGLTTEFGWVQYSSLRKLSFVPPPPPTKASILNASLGLVFELVLEFVVEVLVCVLAAAALADGFVSLCATAKGFIGTKGSIVKRCWVHVTIGEIVKSFLYQ